VAEELSTLFELLPIGAYRAAPDGRLLNANAALVRIFNMGSLEAMRTYFSNPTIHPYRTPARRDEFQTLLRTQRYVVNFESEMVVPNSGGRSIWVREHAHIVDSADGVMLYYEGTIEDISEQRFAQEKLLERENLLQNLLQTIPDRVWLKDIDGVYLTCNKAFAQNLGVDQADVVGTTDFDWVAPEYAQAFAATDQMASRAGTTVVREEGMPTPLSDDSGLYEIVKTPMHDAYGRLIGVLGMARDIQERKRAESQLRETSEQLELAIMSADLGLWSHDLTLDKGYRMDARSCQMLGRPPQDGQHARPWGHLVHPDDLAATLSAMRSHLDGKTTAYEADYRARHTDGRWIWLSSRGKVVQVARDGTPVRMVGTLMDITGRKNTEAQLRGTQAELQATLGALPDLLIEFSAHGDYRAIHSHSSHDLVAPPEVLLGKRVHEMLAKDAADITMAALAEASRTGRSNGMEYSLELREGRRWYELSVVRKPTEAGEEERFIAIARDVTERKQNQEAIAHLAFHDSLTGLPNRRLLAERLQTARTFSQRQQQYCALMFLDLDRFKQLNDTHGHEIGDQMLQEVARRLEQNVRAVDTIARLGGDEFVVLLQALSSSQSDARLHATTVAHKVLAALAEPYMISGHAHASTPSIGITLFCGDEQTAPELLRQADAAMYQAKAMGRNTLAFFA
jgi:diguanylate cyclase (GGDEF)-like protein/PAS domain S-box-containing protein